MIITDKQTEFIKNSNHRFNIKTGATRSGKTYLDLLYTIPNRLRERSGKAGLNVMFGVTNTSVYRNILQPMAEIYGTNLVGRINSRNVVKLFNEDVHIIGAEKITSVSKIRGSSIKYAYCDEITEYNAELFELLKSRLDKEYSVLDGTCNPDHPEHWFKKFLETRADIYQQHYTIDDNPFNPKEFVRQLKIEYEGTIYYNRYILGQWVRAEGTIFSKFADQPEKYRKALLSDIQQINIGVDFGGNKSKHAFVATGILSNFRGIQIIASEIHDTNLDPVELDQKLIDFIYFIYDMTGRMPDNVYCDSAEQVLIRGLKSRVKLEGLTVTVRDAWKTPVQDRIGLVMSLIALDRFSYTDYAETVRNALSQAVWDSKYIGTKRLDDGTTDIDSLDAFEYSVEAYAKRLIRR